MSEARQHPDSDEAALSDELRSALDGWHPPAARAEFRASLRERVRAVSPAADGRATQSTFSAEEQLEVERRLASNASPTARPEFRARLRDEFLRAGEESADVQEKAPLRSVARRREPLTSLPLFVGLAAAAALVLLFFAPWNSSSDKSWHTVGDAVGLDYLLNGRHVSYADSRAVVDSFEKGDCEFRVGEADLSVVHLGEGVMLEFPSGSEFRLPARSKGESGLLEIDLLKGGLRVSTPAGYPGRILVRTPDTTISLAGESIGIDVVAKGTCLCIVNGEAELVPLSGKRELMRAGKNSTAFVERNGAEKSMPGVHHAKELEGFSARRDKYLY